MSLTIPTRSEDLEAALAAVLAERPDLASSPDTLVGALMQAAADISQGLYYAAYAATQDAFPDTAMDDATLEHHAEMRLGPDARKAATVSSGADALQVTGTLAGATVTTGDTLVHTDGTRYQITETIVVGLGTANVSIESISTGTQCNKLTGDKMNFESPPANIQEEVTLVGSLTGGLDEETIDALLGRILDAIVNPPAGGRFADYKAWAETVEGIEHAYVYGPSSASPTGRRGVGVVDVAVLTTGSGASRQPSTDLIAAVQDVIDEERPETTYDSLVLRPDTDTQDVNVQILPGPGYYWDYIQAGETVIGWDAVNLEIELSAPNLTLQSAIDGEGSARIVVVGQLCVADLYTVGSGPIGAGDEIRLTEAPTTPPAAPNPIYAGGPLTEPCMEAIEALFDSLGPARGISADPNQEWDDTLRLSSIMASLRHLRLADGTEQGVAGVIDVVIVDPVDNVAPVDHGAGGTVDFLVPDVIVVRPI